MGMTPPGYSIIDEFDRRVKSQRSSNRSPGSTSSAEQSFPSVVRSILRAASRSSFPTDPGARFARNASSSIVKPRSVRISCSRDRRRFSSPPMTGSFFGIPIVFPDRFLQTIYKRSKLRPAVGSPGLAGQGGQAHLPTDASPHLPIAQFVLRHGIFSCVELRMILSFNAFVLWKFKSDSYMMVISFFKWGKGGLKWLRILSPMI